MVVDPSNAGQRDYWDGAAGEYWAKRAVRFDVGVAEYSGVLLDAAAIEPSDAVLDIGCGTGEMTRLAARRADFAHGVDLAKEMIDYARRQAAYEGLRNVAFIQADAQVHRFRTRYEVAISRHGAIFFGDPVAAFTNIGRALRPGGRMALLSWQPTARNEWLLVIRAALAAGEEPPAPAPDPPGSLKDPEQARALLAAAGFVDVRTTSLAAPMYFGFDADDAVRFLAGQHARTLDALAPDRRARALEILQAGMESHQTERGVLLDSATWLIQARRP